MVLDLERSATIRLRGLPWLRAGDELVPVSIYFGDPGELVTGCDVLEASWSWGASADSGVTTMPDAGPGIIRLLDPERKYDPLTPSSSAGIATTVRILVAGVPAFRGRIDDVKHDLDVCTVTIVDQVSSLAAIQFVETSVPAETSSARVTRILDLAGWPAAERSVGSGGVQLQAGTVSADAWSELLEVARNELGAVYVTPAGVVTYRARAAAWSVPPKEHVTNGSFEALDDPAAPYPWPTGWLAAPNASGIYSSPAAPNVVSGTRAGSIYNGDGVEHQLYQRVTGLTPGTTYVASVWACRSAGTAAGRMQVYEPGTGTALTASVALTNNAPMKKYQATFVAPAGGAADLNLCGSVATGTGWLFDVASIAGPGDPLAELGCPPALVALTSLALAADQSDLVNLLAAARRGGTQRTVQDAPSLARYGRHSHVQNDLEVATDGDRDLWQSFYLTRQREPARGVESVSARPGASAIATLLGLPFGGIVRVKDSGHGPDIDVLSRWLGARWTATPDAVEVAATLGQNQAIAPAARELHVDTPGEWAAIYQTGTNDNLREPGLAVANLPGYVKPSTLRDALEDALEDATRPTPSPSPTPKPKRARKPRAT